MSLVYCASQDQLYAAIQALMPRGRAWQNHDYVARQDSVMQSLLWVIAGEFAYMEAAVCSMIDEYFCQTTDADRDLWLEEFGLPDACDVFGTNLCAKVAAYGDTSPEYYTALAAELGWVADIRWLTGDDPEFPGVISTLHVIIDVGNSPAIAPEAAVENAEVEEAFVGDPDTTSLICSLDGIIPAEAAITYEFINT